MFGSIAATVSPTPDARARERATRVAGSARRPPPRCSGASPWTTASWSRARPTRCARGTTAASAARSSRGCGRGPSRRDVMHARAGGWRAYASRMQATCGAASVLAALPRARCARLVRPSLPARPTLHGPSAFPHRHPHRRRRHHRPGRRLARAEGLGADRRDRRHRRAQLDARRAARRSRCPPRWPRCLTDRPARSLRPRRRAVDPRPRVAHRRARAAPRGGGRAAQRRPARRSRNSSCPAARAPPRSRTWPAPCAAARSARWCTSPPPSPSPSRRAAT